MPDHHQLSRFVEAQDPVYSQVLAELSAGEKAGHWMWYIFPQLQGLGVTPTARHYAVSGLPEAQAYLQHPVLGPRLRECTALAVQVPGRTIQQIFHYPDDLKFRSCMTLFRAAAEDRQIFQDALQKYFGGQPDARTLDILGRA